MNIALFDLDNTLLAGDSDVEWPRYLIGKGVLDADYYNRENDRFYADYKAGTLDIQAFLDFQLAPLAGRDRAELDAWHEEYLARYIRPIITARGRELIQQHQANGDLVVIITATNRFITGPIAAELGVEHLIATEAEIGADGRYTGKPTGTPCFQAGKITRLNAWLAERGQSMASFADSWFYSDSRNDIPLLEQVNHPVAVDPDDALRAHAQDKGWPVVSLRGAF
ncbi:HAD family hydrolase [Rivihabitans pingtungensis]|jgi:HAD superfamily hydrolase (TIGR01490 family)|uniref:histidinol-phosphatase n=1 Tax=Rivihabitans pingtungensis TaxID=1054498 RepID=UPI002FDAA36E